MKKTPRRAVIVGATSGIGYEIALLLVQEGWRLGIAGRRKENLEALQAQYPDQICIRAFDIRQSGAEKELEAYFNVSVEEKVETENDTDEETPEEEQA